jgi:hypothetical protein
MAKKRFVICIDNEGYPASLEALKIYVYIPDPETEKHGMIRVVDESGEDYVYAKKRFMEIELKPSVKRAVLASVAASASA